MEPVESSLYSTLRNSKAELILIGASIIIVVVVLIMIPILFGDRDKRPGIKVADIRIDTKASPNIYIDVAGAVNKPGTYYVSSQSHISDAISAAGGLADSADPDYIAKYINLAKTVENEEKIYIPAKTETYPAETNNKPVNINTATVEELASLPRIGETTAQKIIEHRPYTSIGQLLERKVLSANLFNTVKPLIQIY